MLLDEQATRPSTRLSVLGAILRCTSRGGGGAVGGGRRGGVRADHRDPWGAGSSSGAVDPPHWGECEVGGGCGGCGAVGVGNCLAVGPHRCTCSCGACLGV